MKPLLASLLAVSSLLAAPVPKEVLKPPGLEGTWEVTSFQSLGQATAAYNGARWKIGRETIGIEYPEASGQPAVSNKINTVDASANPKALDYTNYQGQDRKAIYEVDGDKLTLCIPVEPPDRPKALKADGGNLFYTFKRVKE